MFLKTCVELYSIVTIFYGFVSQEDNVLITTWRHKAKINHNLPDQSYAVFYSKFTFTQPQLADVLACSQCSLCVHETCYGVKPPNLTNWLCDRCKENELTKVSVQYYSVHVVDQNTYLFLFILIATKIRAAGR